MKYVISKPVCDIKLDFYDGDSIIDNYIVVGYGRRINKLFYHVQIHNRWGLWLFYDKKDKNYENVANVVYYL